ncbi:DUF484 family protein [Novispirillum sp. DQ9]|uniref:DUF484 family protein n=1 Tax=Novispirillum sp. DQ9 TaxID=3398612 RepID=UPI003C7E0305
MPTRKTGGDEAASAQALPEPHQVAAFLRANPDFLRDHPEIAAEVLPGRDLGSGVADLQAHTLRALRAELDTMRSGAEELIFNARNNMTTQTRTHDAVLAVLAADSFEVLVRTLTDDLPALLQVDLIMLCFEPGLPKGAAVYVQELQAGAVDRLLGAGNASRLRSLVEEEPALYGSGRGLVASDALVRLPVGGTLPPALLALGSRHAGTFHSGQATELLTFLAAVIGHGVRRWVAR